MHEPDAIAELPPVDEAALPAKIAAVREGFWPKLRRVAARIPFAEDVVALYFCAFDRNTPFRVRATLIGALAYFILPTDTLPDLLPLFGFTDDAAVIAAALAAIGGHLNESHRQAARAALGRESPGAQKTADLVNPA